MRLLCFMYMLVSIASALVSVYACMLGCMYVCELGGSFAGGCPSLAIVYSRVDPPQDSI